ncbi:MAG: hypothetical protein AAGI46_09655 [Planctomycetota bacterium]
MARFDPDSTDPAETPVATQELYDASGRLVSVWRPAVDDGTGTSTVTRPRYQYTYDALGNVRTQVDPLGRTTVFHADDRGRTTGRTLPMGQRESTTYDARGRVAEKIAFDGVVTEYVYHDETFDDDVHGSALDWPTDNGTVLPLGRMVEERVFADAQATTPSIVHRYAYDDLGRRTAWGRWLGDDLDLPIDRLDRDGDRRFDAVRDWRHAMLAVSSLRRQDARPAVERLYLHTFVHRYGDQRRVVGQRPRLAVFRGRKFRYAHEPLDRNRFCVEDDFPRWLPIDDFGGCEQFPGLRESLGMRCPGRPEFSSGFSNVGCVAIAGCAGMWRPNTAVSSICKLRNPLANVTSSTVPGR